MLRDRHAVITGAGQGLGAAIADHFVAAGASVLLCARNRDGLEAVRDGLAGRLSPGQEVLIEAADVADPAQVDRLVETALGRFPKIDILVNNAGVHGPIGRLEEVAWPDWIEAININLMGTAYPCRALLPHFRARNYGKIVNLSGGGATKALPRLSAYAASKAAVVRLTETIAEEAAGTGIDVNAVAPGTLATRLLDNVIEAGPERLGAEYYRRMVKAKESGGTPLSTGASLCVYLASAESDGITGRLIAAVWDPWPTLKARVAELRDSDIYTLRRITPEDRGRSWDAE